MKQHPEKVTFKPLRGKQITPKMLVKCGVVLTAAGGYVSVEISRIMLKDLRGVDFAPKIKNALIEEEKKLGLQGSNAFVLDRNRSKEGLTTIIGNPHQGVANPGMIEMQIQTKEGWHMHGATAPGMPALIFGISNNLAFARTSTWDDKVDHYLLF